MMADIMNFTNTTSDKSECFLFLLGLDLGIRVVFYTLLQIPKGAPQRQVCSLAGPVPWRLTLLQSGSCRAGGSSSLWLGTDWGLGCQC